MPDSQRCPLNHDLGNNVEDIIDIKSFLEKPTIQI